MSVEPMLIFTSGPMSKWDSRVVLKILGRFSCYLQKDERVSKTLLL
jgi:hypothetical protein